LYIYNPTLGAAKILWRAAVWPPLLYDFRVRPSMIKGGRKGVKDLEIL